MRPSPLTLAIVIVALTLQAFKTVLLLPPRFPDTKAALGADPPHVPFGPVGFLLVQAHEKATSFGPGFQLHSVGWPPVSVLDCPLLELKTTATRIAVASRTSAQQEGRKSNMFLHDIDVLATNSSCANPYYACPSHTSIVCYSFGPWVLIGFRVARVVAPLGPPSPKLALTS